MNFKVYWKAIAETQLSEIWVRADDRSAVVAAAEVIEGLLTQNPYAVGESRSGPNRVIIQAPLSITYRVDDNSGSVLIVDVVNFRRKSK